MEIMEFCKKVKKSLCIYVGSEVSVSIKQVIKNNGIVLHSIMVTEKGMNISPAIYLDGLHGAYERGETFSKVMEDVFRIYEESRMKRSMDMDFFLDYGNMEGQVVYKLVGYESNKELLSQAPYIRFLDMAIIFYCYVPGKELDNATILIHNSHLELWGITKEKLYQDARENTQRILPPRLLPIEEIMKEIFTQDLQKKCRDNAAADAEWLNEAAGEIMESLAGNGHGPSMYVLGNDKKLFGASVILYDGLLGRIAETLGRSYYLLPSSVHEVILIPDDGKYDSGELWNMVCEINATQVAPEDVLTDSVYYFSEKKNLKGSDSKKSDSKKSDSKESDSKESDAKENDAKESDSKESDSKENDAKESDSKESDSKENDAKDNNIKKKNAEKSSLKENVSWENNGLEKIF